MFPSSGLRKESARLASFPELIVAECVLVASSSTAPTDWVRPLLGTREGTNHEAIDCPWRNRRGTYFSFDELHKPVRSGSAGGGWWSAGCRGRGCDRWCGRRRPRRRSWCSDRRSHWCGDWRRDDAGTTPTTPWLRVPTGLRVPVGLRLSVGLRLRTASATTELLILVCGRSLPRGRRQISSKATL